MYDRVFPGQLIRSRGHEAQNFLALQQLVHRDALVGEDEPHAVPAPEREPYRAPAVSAEIVHAALRAHVLRLGVARGRVKDVGVVCRLVELVRPLRAVIDGRRQQQDGEGVRLDICRLFLKQPARLLVQPGLYGGVYLGAPHLAPVGRGIIGVRKRVHRALHIAEVVPEPDGAGKHALYLLLVPAARAPNGGRLFAQGLHAVNAYELQQLAPALAVRQLREHGEGHVEVHRREQGVLLARAGEKLRRQRLKAGVRRCDPVRQPLVVLIHRLGYRQRRAARPGPDKRHGDGHDQQRRHCPDVPGPARPFAPARRFDQLVGDICHGLVDLFAFLAHVTASLHLISRKTRADVAG